MILQEEFRNNGYLNFLDESVAAQFGIDLEDIFEEKPDELLGIYISKQGDELFFLLEGDRMNINSLCDRWDDRIRVFTILNGNNDAVKKLKYNIVQLIVYSGDAPDKNREGNLMITRKIIIKGNVVDRSRVEIDDNEAIELPFHMIPADAFAPDEEQEKRLNQLIPEDAAVLESAKKQVTRRNRIEHNGVLMKSMDKEDFDKIRGWLER